MAKYILMLSNTPEVIQRVRDTLEPEGYVVAVVPAEADVADEVARHKADLVILAPNLDNEELRIYESRNMKQLGGSSNPERPRVIVLSIRTGGECIMENDTWADMRVFERFHPLEMLAFVRGIIGSSEE